MRSRLTRIVIPVIGLLAVTAALALVGIAPLVLFPPSKEAGLRPTPPPASSEVARVTAPPRPGSSAREPAPSESNSPAGPDSSPAGGPTTGGFLGADAPGKSGGETNRPPLGSGTGKPGQRDEGKHPGQGKESKEKGNGKDKDKGKGKGKDKQKEHKGNANGHSKDKAQGEAKGHGKWQGRTVVAFAPRGAKPSHVRSSGAGKHARRGARSHARPRR